MEGADKKHILIAVAVVVGAALLVLLFRHQSQTTQSTGLGPSSGANALVGGYSTASTVYLPTTAYDITYNTNSNNVNSGNVSTSTTTVNAPASPVAIPTTQQPTMQTTTTSTPTATTTNPAPAAVPVSNYVLPSSTSASAVQGLAAEPHTNVVRSASTGQVFVATGADSYNRSVNAAGGQWITLPGQHNGTWLGGHYNSSGTFVADNATAAANYNKAEAASGKSARAIVA